MAEKKYICLSCNKRFASKSARKQHWRDTDCQWGDGTSIDSNAPAAQEARKKDFDDFIQTQPPDVRRDVFESVVDDDLPDGAYFAMASEFGLEPEDFIDD